MLAGRHHSAPRDGSCCSPAPAPQLRSQADGRPPLLLPQLGLLGAEAAQGGLLCSALLSPWGQPGWGGLAGLGGCPAVFPPPRKPWPGLMLGSPPSLSVSPSLPPSRPGPPGSCMSPSRSFLPQVRAERRAHTHTHAHTRPRCLWGQAAEVGSAPLPSTPLPQAVPWGRGWLFRPRAEPCWPWQPLACHSQPPSAGTLGGTTKQHWCPPPQHLLDPVDCPCGWRLCGTPRALPACLPAPPRSRPARPS